MKIKERKKFIFILIIVFIAFIAIPIISFAYITDTSQQNYYTDYNGTITNATTQQTSAINAMRYRALYSWTYNGENIGPNGYYVYNTKADGSTINIYPNQQYRGILYEMKGYDSSNTSNGSREYWHSSSSQVQTAVDYMVSNNNSYVNGTNNYVFARGTDCSSSVSYAWRRAILGSNDRTSSIFMITNSQVNGLYQSAYTCKKIIQDGNDTSANTSEAYGDYVTRVGQYGNAVNYLGNNTYLMLQKMKEEGNYQYGADVYLRVYAKIKPGDILVTRTGPENNISSHARLVEKVVVVKNSDGSVNPDLSYVVTNEQTSKMKICTNNGLGQTYKTTWLIGYDDAENNGIKYSFKKLATRPAGAEYSSYYLPYRYNGNMANNVAGFIVEQLDTSSISIKWHAQGDKLSNGYELIYATDPSFKDAKEINFDDPNKESTILEDLNEIETYYIKMRSYINHSNGEKEYSGYNNWVSINLSTGDIYRDNAPNPDEVSEEAYREYIYNDIAYSFEEEENEVTDDYE